MRYTYRLLKDYTWAIFSYFSLVIILCRGLYDKNIAHPYNCNKYIACSNEKPFVMPCPSGLNYDPTTNRCEWPHIYPCHKWRHSWISIGRLNWIFCIKFLEFLCIILKFVMVYIDWIKNRYKVNGIFYFCAPLFSSSPKNLKDFINICSHLGKPFYKVRILAAFVEIRGWI